NAKSIPQFFPAAELASHRHPPHSLRPPPPRARPEGGHAPLADVESFIAEHGHLPGVPSAAEVEANGVDVGETQALLLEKIEELTLHLIKLEKENESLKADIAELNK
ncbi:MAG: hypothetical protein AAF998_29220, partial [Bacteroidota bacterium]